MTPAKDIETAKNWILMSSIGITVSGLGVFFWFLFNSINSLQINIDNVRDDIYNVKINNEKQNSEIGSILTRLNITIENQNKVFLEVQYNIRTLQEQYKDLQNQITRNEKDIIRIRGIIK